MKITKTLLIVLTLVGAAEAAQVNLARNSDFSQNVGGNLPSDYTLAGDVKYRYLGDPHQVVAQWGVALQSAGSNRQGSVSQTLAGIDASRGRWFRFEFRGLPQNGFSVDGDNLTMKVEFYTGAAAFDGKAKPIFDLVQQQRKDLSVNGDGRENGAATWHTYQLDFMLPSPRIDRLRLSVAFDHGSATSAYSSEFFVTDFSLTRIDGPDPAAVGDTHATDQRPDNLIPIGGRWFYKTDPGKTILPTLFNYTNADRLIYHDNVWSAPFAGSMTSYLRAGDKDIHGNIVAFDRFVPDNVTVSFDATSMIIHSHGLPNHPTGKFPQEFRGNPNYIQEQNETFYIPLDPKENPNHIVTAIDNSNHALPMGPIGMAINGVVFFNPFDAGNMDASNIMDFCCGHPNQDNLYHYHKYPICINSPWADEGKAHSPLIGFAFDGYPIYGPYVKPGLMAKDATGADGLNDFNIHYDAQRGWHYQVTPGKFPYIIGGYWGFEDPRDRQHPHHPRGMNGGGPGWGPPPDGGPPGGGPPPGGPGWGPPPGPGGMPPE